MPLYIAFSSSSHNLSPFCFSLFFLPLFFRPSCASATPHLCPPSPTPTLTLSLCFVIYYRSLLFVSGLRTFFLSSLFFPLFHHPLPPSPTLPMANTSRLPPSLSAPLLPAQHTTSPLYPCSPPPLLPFCVPSRVHVVRGEY